MSESFYFAVYYRDFKPALRVAVSAPNGWQRKEYSCSDKTFMVAFQKYVEKNIRYDNNDGNHPESWLFMNSAGKWGFEIYFSDSYDLTEENMKKIDNEFDIGLKEKIKEILAEDQNRISTILGKLE